MRYADGKRTGVRAALLIVVVAAGAPAYAADGHTDSHSDGHASGGHGKGPKYMGGNRGTSHGSPFHKGGSSHHDQSAGGAESVEDKIFHVRGGGHDRPGESHTDDAVDHVDHTH